MDKIGEASKNLLKIVNNILDFSKVFKKHTDQTPAQYRKTERNLK